jgi:hypothetical protein
MCDSSFTIPPTIPKTTLIRLMAEHENRYVSNKEASDSLAEIQRKVLHAAALGHQKECFAYPQRVMNSILAHVYTMLPGCTVLTSSFPYCGQDAVHSPGQKMVYMNIIWA